MHGGRREREGLPFRLAFPHPPIPTHLQSSTKLSDSRSLVYLLSSPLVYLHPHSCFLHFILSCHNHVLTVLSMLFHPCLPCALTISSPCLKVAIQKYSAPLEGEKRSFILEANLSDHDPGTQIQVTCNSVFQGGNSLLSFYSNGKRNSSNTLLETLRRQVTAELRCCVTAFLALWLVGN